jgi:hypothetical protein
MIWTIASAFVVEEPLGPGFVQDAPSHVTVTVLFLPEMRELFTNVQATAIAAVVGDETEIVAVVPVNVTPPVTWTAIGSRLWKNMKPRQFPLLVEEGAVHQIQKPNCAGPEHVVFLQEKELGSALALKTIPGEAIGSWAATACQAIGNAAIATKKRAVTKLRRITIAGSPPGF